MTPIERIKNLDKRDLKLTHNAIWDQVETLFSSRELRSLIWGIGADDKFYINATIQTPTGDRYHIIRVDGSERGLFTGTLWFETVKIYKRSASAYALYCKYVSNEVQCAVHEAYMNLN